MAAITFKFLEMISTIKKFGLAVLLVTVVGVFSANAQAKVIALINKASWCPVCKANGPRVMKDLMPMLMGNKEVMVVMNDVSNKETKEKSAPMLEKAGLTTFAENHIATGMLYFIDAQSKKWLGSVSMANPNMQIKMVFKKAMMEASK